MRPVTLLLLHTRADQPGAELVQYLRQPDMVFQLGPGQFLIVLQGSNLEGPGCLPSHPAEPGDPGLWGAALQGISVQQALAQPSRVSFNTTT